MSIGTYIDAGICIAVLPTGIFNNINLMPEIRLLLISYDYKNRPVISRRSSNMYLNMYLNINKHLNMWGQSHKTKCTPQ